MIRRRFSSSWARSRADGFVWPPPDWAEGPEVILLVDRGSAVRCGVRERVSEAREFVSGAWEVGSKAKYAVDRAKEVVSLSQYVASKNQYVVSKTKYVVSLAKYVTSKAKYVVSGSVREPRRPTRAPPGTLPAASTRKNPTRTMPTVSQAPGERGSGRSADRWLSYPLIIEVS